MQHQERGSYASAHHSDGLGPGCSGHHDGQCPVPRVRRAAAAVAATTAVHPALRRGDADVPAAVAAATAAVAAAAAAMATAGTAVAAAANAVLLHPPERRRNADVLLEVILLREPAPLAKTTPVASAAGAVFF